MYTFFNVKHIKLKERHIITDETLSRPFCVSSTEIEVDIVQPTTHPQFS